MEIIVWVVLEEKLGNLSKVVFALLGLFGLEIDAKKLMKIVAFWFQILSGMELNVCVMKDLKLLECNAYVKV